MPILFNSLTSVIAEFPVSNFIFTIFYPAKIRNFRELSIPVEPQIEPHVFVLFILQFIWRDLAVAFENLNKGKK